MRVTSATAEVKVRRIGSGFLRVSAGEVCFHTIGRAGCKGCVCSVFLYFCISAISLSDEGVGDGRGAPDSARGCRAPHTRSCG